MPIEPSQKLGHLQGSSEPGSRHSGRVLAGILVVGGALAVAPLLGAAWQPGDAGLLPVVIPLGQPAGNGEDDSAAQPGALPPLTNGVGRPLASGEIGTVLSILFKEAPAAADMPDELLRATPTLPEAKVQSRGGIEPEQARTIQSRLAALGFLEGDVNGPWGPPSRQALRDFKATHNLPADEIWDEATERALASASAAGANRIVGVWAPDPNACSPKTNRKGLLPAVINHQGAWAGDVSCAFKNGRRDGDAWRFAATCSGARKRWTANVKLAVAGDTLVWSSERGSQTYVRCPSGTG